MAIREVNSVTIREPCSLAVQNLLTSHGDLPGHLLLEDLLKVGRGMLVVLLREFQQLLHQEVRGDGLIPRQRLEKHDTPRAIDLGDVQLARAQPPVGLRPTLWDIEQWGRESQVSGKMDGWGGWLGEGSEIYYIFSTCRGVLTRGMRPGGVGISRLGSPRTGTQDSRHSSAAKAGGTTRSSGGRVEGGDGRSERKEMGEKGGRLGPNFVQKRFED